MSLQLEIKIFILLLSWFGTYPSTGFSVEPQSLAQGFKVITEVSSTEMGLNEKVIISLHLAYPKDYHPDLFSLKSRLLNPFGIVLVPFKFINEEISPSQKKNEEVIQQDLTFHLEPLIPGDYELSFRMVSFFPQNTDSNSVVHIPTESFSLKVLPFKKSLLALKERPLFPLPLLNLMRVSSENQNRFMEGPTVMAKEAQRNIDRYISKQFPWMLFYAFAISLVAFYATPFIFQFFKGRWSRKATRVDPKIKALKDLKKLKQKNFFSQNREFFFYQELADILRFYIEGYYHIKAPEYTTEQLLKNIFLVETLKKEDALFLKDFFLQADQIKFASTHPTQEECENAYHRVYSMIERD